MWNYNTTTVGDKRISDDRVEDVQNVYTHTYLLTHLLTASV